MDYLEKLEQARMTILVSNQLRIFGCLFYNFEIRVIETNDIIADDLSEDIKEVISHKLTACVSISNNKPILTIFSSFIKRKTVSELIFVILHEILHILGGHNIRQGEKKNEVYNLAADHIINTTLKEDVNKKILNSINLPDDAFIIEEIENKKLTIHEVYEWLMKNSSNETISIKVAENGEGSDDKGEEIDISVLKINIDGKELIIPMDIDFKNSTDSSNEANKEIIKQLQSEARAIMNEDSIIKKGDISGNLFELINKMIEVEIPWTELLKRSISNKIVPSDDNRSWRRLKKRPYALGLTFPDIDEDEKPSILIIGEDQSGSISDIDIKKFANVIYQASKFFDEIRVIKHDVEVHSDISFKAIDFTDEKVLFETYGRGGTSHKPIFKKIEESYENDDEISLIILLTDFDSDIERIWDNFKWTKYIPVSLCICKKTNKTIPTYIDNKPIII